jgi:hypothetical protein
MFNKNLGIPGTPSTLLTIVIKGCKTRRQLKTEEELRRHAEIEAEQRRQLERKGRREEKRKRNKTVSVQVAF